MVDVKGHISNLLEQYCYLVPFVYYVWTCTQNSRVQSLYVLRLTRDELQDRKLNLPLAAVPGIV